MVLGASPGEPESWRRWESGVLGAPAPEPGPDEPDPGGTGSDEPGAAKPAAEKRESLEDLVRWTAAARARVRYR